jgi:hypothetical protein
MNILIWVRDILHTENEVLVFQYVNILHIENNKGYYSVCKPNSALLICYITYYGHLYIKCLMRYVESYVLHKPLISVLRNWQKALLFWAADHQNNDDSDENINVSKPTSMLKMNMK